MIIKEKEKISYFVFSNLKPENPPIFILIYLCSFSIFLVVHRIFLLLINLKFLNTHKSSMLSIILYFVSFPVVSKPKHPATIMFDTPFMSKMLKREKLICLDLQINTTCCTIIY